MNILPLPKLVAIAEHVIDGDSMRRTARAVGCNHETVLQVRLRLGCSAAALLAQHDFEDDVWHGMFDDTFTVDSLGRKRGTKPRSTKAEAAGVALAAAYGIFCCDPEGDGITNAMDDEATDHRWTMTELVETLEKPWQ